MVVGAALAMNRAQDFCLQPVYTYIYMYIPVHCSICITVALKVALLCPNILDRLRGHRIQSSLSAVPLHGTDSELPFRATRWGVGNESPFSGRVDSRRTDSPPLLSLPQSKIHLAQRDHPVSPDQVSCLSWNVCFSGSSDTSLCSEHILSHSSSPCIDDSPYDG